MEAGARGLCPKLHTFVTISDRIGLQKLCIKSIPLSLTSILHNSRITNTDRRLIYYASVKTGILYDRSFYDGKVKHESQLGHCDDWSLSQSPSGH